LLLDVGLGLGFTDEIFGLGLEAQALTLQPEVLALPRIQGLGFGLMQCLALVLYQLRPSYHHRLVINSLTLMCSGFSYGFTMF